MPTAAPALPTIPNINTQGLQSASISSAHSREQVPISVTDAYAAASAAYYERTSYPYDSRVQAYDPYDRQIASGSSRGRNGIHRTSHENDPSDGRNAGAAGYDGLLYDRPASSEYSAVSSSTAAPRLRHGQQAPPLAYDPDYVIAMHDYNPPAPDANYLAFHTGDFIHVLNRDGSGWWDGELDGRRGWFPSNYISTDATVFAAAAELAGLSNHTAIAVVAARQRDDSSRTISGRTGQTSSGRKSPTSRNRHRGGRRSSTPTESSDMSESVLDRRASCPPIMIPMLHSLALLRNSVKANRVLHFQPAAACIISCTRSVLSTCECLNKDSPHLLQSPPLAAQRKKVLNELASLVSKARQASEPPATSEASEVNRKRPLPLDPERLRAVQEMIKVGDSVYHSVRKFMTMAAECGIELPPDQLFDGAPGMEESRPAYAARPSLLSSNEEDEPLPTSSATPKLSSPTTSRGKHARKSSSTSALARKASLPARMLVDADETAVVAPSGSVAESAPYTEVSQLSSAIGKPAGISQRPHSFGEFNDDEPLGPFDTDATPLSPTRSTTSGSRKETTPRSHRGINGYNHLHRSEAREASLPYRKPKYSVSSVSSVSSYESSQTSSGTPETDVGHAFPSGFVTTQQALGTLRVTHDRLLSVIAAFIGHIHGHSRTSHASSKGHLIEMTRKTVDQVRYLLTLVDAVEESPKIREAKPREVAVVKETRLVLYSATNDIVEAIKDMLSPDDSTSEEEDKQRALQAATGALRAGGECVKSVNMCLSTRIGQEPFMIHIDYVPIADSPTHTVAPSVSSSRASSSPPSTPKSATFRPTHTHSMSQPTAQAPRTKGHKSSASVSASTNRRRAHSDVSPARVGPYGRPSEEVAETVPEEVEEGGELEEETVRFPKEDEPPSSPADDSADDSSFVNVDVPQTDDEDIPPPRLVVKESQVQSESELPSPRKSVSTDITAVSTSVTEPLSIRTSLDTADPHASMVPETDASSIVSTKVDDDLETPQTPGAAAAIALEEKLLRGELPATPSAPPEFIESMYDPRDLMVNDVGQFVAGSLDIMVIKLAPFGMTHPERSFVTTFLLTFHLFTTPAKFVEALVNRWNAEPVAAEAASDSATMMRVRIGKCVKMWIDTYWNMEVDDPVLPLLQSFVDTPLPDGADASVRSILGSIQTLVHAEVVRAQKGGRRAPNRARTGAQLMAVGLQDGVAMPIGDVPTPIMKRAVNPRLGTMDLDTPVTEIDALEVARQLTLIEAKLYCDVPAQELVDLGTAGAKSEHVKAISTYSTAVTGWVSECILNETDQKKRSGLLKYFVKLANCCLTLSNFSTMRALLAALDSSTISRLTKTWSNLSAKYRSMIDNMRRLADHAKNYAYYRETLRATPPPAVPFMGLYLTDLTFCREGNPSTRPSPLDPKRPLINFLKYHRLARIVQDVQRFQMTPYSLQPVPEVQKYLSHVIEKSKNTGDLQDLYRRSLILEPRQANDAAPPDTKSGLLGWASRS